MRFLTAGESHGEGLVGILEGMPSGMCINVSIINEELSRRQNALGRGARMRIEQDEVKIMSGLHNGVTTGAPIAIYIANRDHGGKRDFKFYRPGHVDYVSDYKYKYGDPALGSERASARETAMRTALGAIAKQLLSELGISVTSKVLEIGGDTGEEMEAAIQSARQHGDTLGGKLLVKMDGLRAGIGSHVCYDRRLDYMLAGALMSIPAVKAVESGIGVEYAILSGKECADVFTSLNGRYSNNCGGIEGGISNGQAIKFILTVKPIPSVSGLETVDANGEPCLTEYVRGDICAVHAAAVVAEGVAALEVCRAIIECCGGDTLEELSERYFSKGE